MERLLCSLLIIFSLLLFVQLVFIFRILLGLFVICPVLLLFGIFCCPILLATYVYCKILFDSFDDVQYFVNCSSFVPFKYSFPLSRQFLRRFFSNAHIELFKNFSSYFLLSFGLFGSTYLCVVNCLSCLSCQQKICALSFTLIFFFYIFLQKHMLNHLEKFSSCFLKPLFEWTCWFEEAPYREHYIQQPTPKLLIL